MVMAGVFGTVIIIIVLIAVSAIVVLGTWHR
jgi:hypothetical protein